MSRLREAEAVASSAAAEAQAARAHADACQSQLAMARLEEGVNKELAGQVRGWEAFYTGLGRLGLCYDVLYPTACACQHICQRRHVG